MKHSLHIPFIFLVLLFTIISTYAQDEKNVKLQSLYQKFLDNRVSSNFEQTRIAYKAAKEYLSISDRCSEVDEYLRRWVAIYEAAHKPSPDISVWYVFEKCHFSFIIPSSLKELKTEPLNSYMVSFADENLTLSLNFSEDSRRVKNNEERFLDFTEENIETDNQKIQFVTYALKEKYSFKDSKNFVTEAFIEFIQPISENTKSLRIKIRGKTKKDVQIIKPIFRTIKLQK